MSMITYNRDIPDGPHNPSADQPLMKDDTNAIDDIIAVDHRTFNENASGYHKSIHFDQNSGYVPGVFPVNPPQFFTGSSTTLPTFGFPNAFAQLFYFTGNAIDSSNQYAIATTGGVANSSGPNGSVMLFAGFIMKWGVAAIAKTTSTHGEGTVLFNTTGAAFPNHCFLVNVNLRSLNTTKIASISFKEGSESVTGFQYIFNVNSADTLDYTQFNWWAIGN